MEGLKPGRIVYYVDSDGSISPAVVSCVHNQDTGMVNLRVFADNRGQLPWAVSVPFDSDKTPFSWHWMFEGQATRYQPDRTEAATKVGGTT